MPRRLTADVADPGGPDSNPVAISLVNPKGQIVAYSLPQGTGDHGQVEVRTAAGGHLDRGREHSRRSP